LDAINFIPSDRSVNTLCSDGFPVWLYLIKNEHIPDKKNDTPFTKNNDVTPNHAYNEAPSTGLNNEDKILTEATVELAF
jgi:hypothetical protein